MNNLLETSVMDEINTRLGRLSGESKAHWGKMTVAQMLAHLQVPFEFALAEKQYPKMFPLSLFGWIFKKQLYKDDPWKQGLATAPVLRITDERDFSKEKSLLQKQLDRFQASKEQGVGNFSHPAFGRFTKQQWGKMMYKHLDHHFRQFGV